MNGLSEKQERDQRNSHAKKSLDEMIMDVEVEETDTRRIKVKFLALAGGNGPGFDMDKSIAIDLYNKLGEVLRSQGATHIGSLANRS